MSWSFSIGRLCGSDLRVHATFFLLLAWVGTAAYLADGAGAALTNVLFILALFACVVAHEFGHALMALRFGIRTPDITLLPIGGVARLERMPERPAQEIAVAVAGPAVNVVIWLALTLLAGAETRIEALQTLDDAGQGFLARLASVNLFLVLFNLVPAFPMDGGRVLRAALAIPLGRLRATRAAGRAGQAIAFIFGFLGLTTGNPILLLIGVFVFFAAAAETSDVEMKAVSRTAHARDAMITSFESLAPSDTLAAAGQALVRTTQAEFPVLDDTGHLVGFLTRPAILAASEAHPHGARVADLMERDIPLVRLDDPLDAVIDGLARPGAPAVGVTDGRGAFLGYVTRENIGEWLILRRAIQG